ncbi:MAG TPA: Gfo/Idh/MocA family oxidoreductase [Acidimicrobiales bacterium]|nr:Gfo/Idh/MocA family oxidoreductase [Acidimicrobiales bacterium]
MVRVGLIGANPDRGWALAAHLPALRQLPEYEVVAVATSREETARRSLEVYGAVRAYPSSAELIEDPDVDLVVLTVKVPLHAGIVGAALDAGKDVLCEWPLGNRLAEAEGLLDQARRAKVRHFIGLQARAAPAVRYLRHLVADGYVGDVLSSSVVASGFGWGSVIDESQAYLFDSANGATMLTVTGGHLLDAVRSCLGDLHDVRALIAQRRRSVAVLEVSDVERCRRFEAVVASRGSQSSVPGNVVVPQDERPTAVADQIAVAAVLDNGAVFSIHLRGGQFRTTNFLWEINGTEGDLQVTAGGGTIQIYPLTIRGARGATSELVELPVPEEYLDRRLAGLSGAARNVGYLYRDIADDVREGSRTAPDFSTAVEVHHLLETISAAAGTGSPR